MLLTSSISTQSAIDYLDNKTLVILDAGVDHVPLLATDVSSSVDLLILDSQSDGLAQITAALMARQSVSSLHIVSHGSPGRLSLGNTQISFDSLDRDASQLGKWAGVLQGGDILIYGCQVAQGVKGHLFLQQLHQLTGANIAASEQRVGHVDSQQNWHLETQIGQIQTPLIFSEQLQASYPGNFETVNFSISTDTLIESEGTPFSFNFSVDGPIPAGGSVVRLEGSIPQAINQLNLFALSFTGLAGQPVDVSPNQDFSAFDVTIVAPNASISLPVFNDFLDDSPQAITWNVTPVSAGTTVSGSGATVTIFDDPSEVPAANAAPVADNDSYDTGFETELTIDAGNGVLNGDTDADGDALTATLVGNPSNGSVSLNGDGSFVYTPNAGFSGADSFTYQANDGTANSNLATVNVNVGAAPSIPEVSLTSDITTLVEDEGTEVTFTLSLSEAPAGPVIVDINTGKAFALGDFDVFPPGPAASATGGQLVGGNSDNSGFRFAITAQTATITLPIFNDEDRTADGTQTDPNGPLRNDDIGEEQTTFTLASGDGYTVSPSANSVTLTLRDTNAVANSAPVADDDSYSTAFDTILTVDAATGVLDGDTDADGDTLSAAISTDPSNGTVALSADGSFSYTPNAGFSGDDSFTYSVSDGNGGTDTATVTVNVAAGPTNAAPVADDDSYSTAFNTALTVDAAMGVLDGDTDADGDPLTAAISTDPSNGTVALNADGSFSYTPNAGFSGDDSFTYSVSDGNGGTDTATVTVAVAPDTTGGGDPIVSFSTTPTLISEADGTALVMNFSVEGDIPPEGITVNLEGDAARIMQQFTVAQTRFDADTGNILYRFDNGFAENAEGLIVGGTLDRFSLEDGDPSETNSDPAAAGDGFLSNFSFTITEANASITIPVFDDIVEEADATFTYTLAAGDGYTVSETANSGTFTVTDGVTPATSPTVGVTATPTTLVESEQTLLEVTFTTAGDIPAEGLVVQLSGPPRAIAEFDVNATNPRLPEDETVVEGVTVTGGNIVGTDEVAGSLFLRITDPTATITVPVFQDDVAEGTEVLPFTLIDGEAYEVDPAAGAVEITIEDGISSGGDPVVSFSTEPTLISEADGTALVMNFSVEGDIPPEGITVNLEGDAARIMQQFTVAQTRFDADTGNIFYRFDNGFAENAEGLIVGGTLDRFSLEDGDPSETNSDPAAAGDGFLSNFSFTITEANASITIPVIDDIVEEVDQTFTYTLVSGDGYTVSETANSGTFTVTDGVTPATSPTVGVTATPTTLVESEQTVVEVTFTTAGDIPAEGLVVQLSGPPRAIAEFDVNATNPRLPEDETVVEGVTVTGGNIVGTDEVAGSLFLRITDPTATITVPVFQDDVAEGTEVLPFTLIDGEAYEVDPAASAVEVTIEDGVISEGPVVSFTTSTDSLNEAEGTPITFNFSVSGDFPEDGIVIRTDENFFPNTQLDFNLLDFANPEVINGIEFFDFEEIATGQFLIDWRLTQPEAFISVAVFDDNLAEPDGSFTTGLLPGEGYTLNPDATSATIFVTDGVDGTGGPLVSLAVDQTEVNEGEPLTITLAADGEIPTGGLEVFVDSDTVGAIGDFITVGSDGNPTVTFTGLAGFPAPNEDASGFTVVMTDNTATVSFDVFDDGPGEGPESFEFSVLDGENYDVNADASTVNITINDEVDGGLVPDIVGNDEGETLEGSDADNFIQALGGDDTVAGGLGNDIIEGGDGDDVLRGDRNSRATQDGEAGGNDIIFGGDGNDRIGGKAGNDILSGDAGDDMIYGDDGDDILMGVTGNDILVGDNGSGGSGSDLFVFGNGDGTDTIVDFEIGIDRIGLVQDELVFADLTITQDGSNTLLGVASTGETLAVLNNVQASALGEASFAIVPDVSNPEEAIALI